MPLTVSVELLSFLDLVDQTACLSVSKLFQPAARESVFKTCKKAAAAPAAPIECVVRLGLCHQYVRKDIKSALACYEQGREQQNAEGDCALLSPI
jgi:hypothetical protein